MVVTRWIQVSPCQWYYSYAYSERYVETVFNSHFRHADLLMYQEST